MVELTPYDIASILLKFRFEIVTSKYFIAAKKEIKKLKTNEARIEAMKGLLLEYLIKILSAEQLEELDIALDSPIVESVVIQHFCKDVITFH
ncbi:MAG: hypothetical protein RML94_01840 [Bacteroidia bacterium]|nr:hypothetical protein [Bacteroidia bacterium]